MSDEQDNTQQLQPLLGDLMTRAVRRLVSRGRRELNRAAGAGKSRLEIRQLEQDLDHFWTRMGRTAYHLSKAGEINHPALSKAEERIDQLQAQLDQLRSPPPTTLPPQDEVVNSRAQEGP